MPRPKPRKRAELPDAGLDPEALAVPEYRREQINVRVTEVELRSIRAVAKRLRVSVSDYLVGLHRQAVQHLSQKKKDKR